MNTILKSNRHAKYKLTYHLVVVTKYRNKVINDKMLTRIKEIVKDLFVKWDCELIEFNGDNDHIHLLIETPPQVQLSKLINNIKTVTSRLLRKEFKERVEHYYWKGGFWSPSYCIVTTGGASLDVIKDYIKNQDKK